MRVIILGGYGVFGLRLAKLLRQDDHELWIAGRDKRKARAAARLLGARFIVIDRTGNLEPLTDIAPDAVIDAAARQAGVVVLSGASSVPAISSAVVAELSADLETLEVIEAAILPGNRAPRGRSVIASILHQVGAPLRLWRGGAWRVAVGWSDKRTYALENGLRRSAWIIGAPDLLLFPDHFAARSVSFRAGLELWSMNVSLAALSWLRKQRLVGDPVWLVGPLRWLAERMESLGSDRGGMVVDVVGETAAGETIQRRWMLIAEAGDGPFIPATPVRALLRRLDRIAPGARPCLGDAPLSEIDAAMSDLAARTCRSEQPRTPLFQQTLKDRFGALPPTVRRLHRLHDLESFSGVATVERGGGPIARLIGWLFRFPDAGEDIPVTVEMIRRADGGEIWRRCFAGKTFRSHLTSAPNNRVYERFGPLKFELTLTVEDGALRFPVARGWALGVPLPRFLLPTSDTREFERDGVAHFDVRLTAPLGFGLLVRYRGWLRPDEAYERRERPAPSASSGSRRALLSAAPSDDRPMD